MSVKTTLSQLLEQKLLKLDPKGRVFRISLMWMEIPDSPWTFADGFKKLME
jgi:hypothetical protein